MTRKEVESTPKNLAESTIGIILENFESTSGDDSDTSDISESSVEVHSFNLRYEFRHKRSATGYANCKYCPYVSVEKDKEVSHILSWYMDLLIRMSEAPRSVKFVG